MSRPLKNHKDLAKRDKKIILSLLLIALVIAGVLGLGHGAGIAHGEIGKSG